MGTMGAEKRQLPKMGNGENRNLGILVKEMAFGQKGGGAGALMREGKPQYYLLASYICVYFYTYPLECFLFVCFFTSLVF